MVEPHVFGTKSRWNRLGVQVSFGHAIDEDNDTGQRSNLEGSLGNQLNLKTELTLPSLQDGAPYFSEMV